MMMPERLATTDPFRQITEMIGSGPFRFIAKDRVPGSLIAYEQNAAYVPRSSGTASFTAGPKRVHVDRVEWHVTPDPAVHVWIRGNGIAASRGWPDGPKLEALRQDWLFATDDAVRKRIAEDIQQQVFVDVPYIPVGQFLPRTVYQQTVTGVLRGYALFWNLTKA